MWLTIQSNKGRKLLQAISSLNTVSSSPQDLASAIAVLDTSGPEVVALRPPVGWLGTGLGLPCFGCTLTLSRALQVHRHTAPLVPFQLALVCWQLPTSTISIHVGREAFGCVSQINPQSLQVSVSKRALARVSPLGSTTDQVDLLSDGTGPTLRVDVSPLPF